MTSLTDRVMALNTEARSAAIMVLDELSRPLDVREIEAALRRHGVSKSRAVIIASSIRKLNIIAVVGSEGRGGDRVFEIVGSGQRLAVVR